MPSGRPSPNSFVRMSASELPAGSRAPSPTLTPASDDERAIARREASILLLTTLGIMMVAVDSTIVILALPTMARELTAPLQTIIWTILIYLLISTALTTQAGRLGDLWGRGPIFNAGFAIFTVASVACGLAPNATILIASRAVQAVGGALIFANAPAVITAAIPAVRRGRAFGFTVFGYSVGAILGILLGGLITTLVGWRYIFFINAPIGIVAVYLGLRTIPRTERVRTSFDVPGFLVFSGALTLISYGAIEIASYGVTVAYLLYVVAGLALLPVFVAVELASAQPMIDLRLLRDRVLGFTLMTGFVQSLGYLAVIFLLTMYLQGVRGLSPLNASLLLVPGYIVGAVAGPFFGRRINRFGTRIMMTSGIALMTVAVLGYSFLSVTTWLGVIPVISLVQGFGAGMFYPAMFTATMSRAPPSALGSVGGIRATLGNMGMLLSFVLVLTIASASVPRYVAYEVFLGTTNLVGGVGASFMDGIRAALYGLVAILIVAAFLAWARGPDTPTEGTLVRTTTGGPPSANAPPSRTEPPARAAESEEPAGGS
jgi:EmrB/QacA subfamily drug resistance transporter